MLHVNGSIPLFDRKRPSLRPDLPSGRAPRAAAVKDAAVAAPAQPARSVLDRASTALGWRGRGSGGMAQRLLFVLAQIVHVQITMLLEPVLVGFDRQRPDQPQATLAIGKDAHDVTAISPAYHDHLT